ncbi:hypothetical protein [Acidovorax sp.]|uniref:hypothetical protein n=1 Tax=Acidovorax sp. TaxID=1872122 RepID=UPI004038096A
MFIPVSGPIFRLRDYAPDPGNPIEYGAFSKPGHENCYVVMVEHEGPGWRLPVTRVVADETWLEIMLEEIKPARVLSITWLRPKKAGYGWRAIDVRELFSEDCDSVSSGYRLVMRTASNKLLDCNGKALEVSAAVFRTRVRTLFVADDEANLVSKRDAFAPGFRS